MDQVGEACNQKTVLAVGREEKAHPRVRREVLHPVTPHQQEDAGAGLAGLGAGCGEGTEDWTFWG